jgi:large subunit ribosomal protein L10
MLTKEQKKEHVAASAKLIAASKSLVFANFAGAPTKEIEKLKAELKKIGATYKVFKKRLLKIALKEAGVTVDTLSEKAPVVTVFAQGDMTSVAAPVYKFVKELAKRKIEFKVLGAFDRAENKPMTVAEFNVIARLPSREVLLGQVVGTMTGPIRKFMVVLQEVAKKKEATPSA